MEQKVEILAPAGSYESLCAAVSAGADAVYMGGARFGARAYAENPDEETLLRAIDYTHIHGRKIYLTVNTLLKDREMTELYSYLLPYYCGGIDGVIVQDVGVIEYIREYFPGLPIHASTQMTVTGTPGIQFLKKMGVERVVPAREVSLDEIRTMKKETGMEIECFVHGALCYCYSGQCLFSSILGGRSGNRGQCAQPCRLPYGIDGKKPRDILSLKDLCTVDILPELIAAGIDSFKIEGRMKQPEYVYTVVRIYRKYVDLCRRRQTDGYKVEEADREQLLAAYRRRGYSDGYYRQHNGREMISWERPAQKPGEENRREQKAAETSDYKIQEKINGKFILSPGKRATLILMYPGVTVQCEGDVAEAAKKQPLDTARIRKQMKKTTDTDYCFDQLDIQMQGEVFLPVKSMNELRRKGIGMLEEAILKPYRRESPEKKAPGEGFLPLHLEKRTETKHAAEKDLSLTASVSGLEQLKEVLSNPEIQTVYIDSQTGRKPEVEKLVLKEQEKGRRLFLALPYIFRESTQKLFERFLDTVRVYDGVLIRNFESYEWLLERGYEGEIRSDSNLYLFNRYGRTFLRRTKIDSYTAPAELNERELLCLGMEDCAMPVYGYQPLMVTANCIQKTTKECSHKDKTLFISDRYKKKFAVKNYCESCYNIIYNCAPLMLLDQKEALLKLKPKELRMDFTIESQTQVKAVLKCYLDVFLRDQEAVLTDMEFTRGHFKRGVK